MKKLFLILILLGIWSVSDAQKYIQCGTDTIIQASGCDFINNNVRYDLEIGDTLTGHIEYIPELWSILDESTVSLFDVGKKGRICLYNFGTEVLFYLRFSHCSLKNQ